MLPFSLAASGCSMFSQHWWQALRALLPVCILNVCCFNFLTAQDPCAYRCVLPRMGHFWPPHKSVMRVRREVQVNKQYAEPKCTAQSLCLSKNMVKVQKRYPGARAVSTRPKTPAACRLISRSVRYESPLFQRPVDCQTGPFIHPLMSLKRLLAGQPVQHPFAESARHPVVPSFK